MVKRTPEQVNPPFCQFSCVIVHGIFGDPEFQPHFCQILPGRLLIPYLLSQLALIAKTAHYQNQTMSSGHGFLEIEFDLIFSKILQVHPLRSYLWSHVGPHGQNGPFSRSNDPEPINPPLC
ncbi:hypothetical protein H5410_064068 [Solanum commersonii]|uniref:Uncharacterized protein n=1 Tax=Solanum commersonii TaxID=4109 RepID=A0A9J5W0G3_SOLCO|nr:hypothetical protein H5410_064068 [Solanum commersonii]